MMTILEGLYNRNSPINYFAIDNIKIIACYKNFKILFFKEAIKINEIKPTLNIGLKSSKKLQLFEGVSKHLAIISCN